MSLVNTASIPLNNTTGAQTPAVGGGRGESKENAPFAAIYDYVYFMNTLCTMTFANVEHNIKDVACSASVKGNVTNVAAKTITFKIAARFIAISYIWAKPPPSNWTVRTTLTALFC